LTAIRVLAGHGEDLKQAAGRPAAMHHRPGLLSEAANRIQQFELQAKRDGRWGTFGREADRFRTGPKFPKSSCKVRLNVLSY
jgi:hypothetical protein